MRTSPLMRAVSASAAATLFLSLGVEAPLAHGGPSFGAPVMRAGSVHGHSGALGWRHGSRSSWAWRGENRWSRNGRFWNGGGFYGSGFWFSPYAYADTGSDAGGGPVVAVGAPTLNIFPAAATEGFDSNSGGGCVIHKLIYDRAGNYVGERQTPAC
jgi:hypothetical protein